MSELILRRSHRKNKKFEIFNPENNKSIHFGDTRYKDFTMHHDKARKEKYLKRAKNIKDKNGDKTHNDPNSPNFWSINLLWNKKTIQKSIEDLDYRYSFNIKYQDS